MLLSFNAWDHLWDVKFCQILEILWRMCSVVFLPLHWDCLFKLHFLWCWTLRSGENCPNFSKTSPPCWCYKMALSASRGKSHIWFICDLFQKLFTSAIHPVSSFLLWDITLQVCLVSCSACKTISLTYIYWAMLICRKLSLRMTRIAKPTCFNFPLVSIS